MSFEGRFQVEGLTQFCEFVGSTGPFLQQESIYTSRWESIKYVAGTTKWDQLYKAFETTLDRFMAGIPILDLEEMGRLKSDKEKCWENWLSY